MATLGSINGSSLAPDIVGAIGSGYQLGAGIRANQKKVSDQATTEDLRNRITQGGPDAYDSWQQLSALDPSAANEMTAMIQNRYMAADKESQAMIDKNGQEAHIALLQAQNGDTKSAREYISALAQHNQDMGLPADHYNQALGMSDDDLMGTLKTHAAVYDAAIEAKKRASGQDMTAAERNLAAYNAASPEDKAVLGQMLNIGEGSQSSDAQYLKPTKDGMAVYDIRYPDQPARPIMGPNGKPYSPAQGAVEARYMDAMLGNANEATAAISNIIDMPDGGDSGVFGYGKIPGKGLFESGMTDMKNRLAPENVKSYNTMIKGIARQMGVVSGMGMQPNQTIVSQMEGLSFVDGDTQFDKARKLAEVRQLVEKSLEVKLHNPRVPDETKQLIKDITANIHNVVPYTQKDLNDLKRKQEKNPNYTLQNLIDEKNKQNAENGNNEQSVNPMQSGQSSGGALSEGATRTAYMSDGTPVPMVVSGGKWVRQ